MVISFTEWNEYFWDIAIFLFVHIVIGNLSNKLYQLNPILFGSKFPIPESLKVGFLTNKILSKKVIKKLKAYCVFFRVKE
jgi:hypothetical protein